MNYQAQVWKGDFGNEYANRNGFSIPQIAARIGMWERIYESLPLWPSSVLEVGANIGLNLRSIQSIDPNAQLAGTEPNDKARSILRETGLPVCNDEACDLCSWEDGAAVLAFTCGVLIHIHPDNLLQACKEIHRVSSRYIACIEYFSDKPEEIEYRGQKNMLWKRDFGAFYLDNFPDLKCIDYGFFWKRQTGLDNLTWWLFEKAARD